MPCVLSALTKELCVILPARGIRAPLEPYRKGLCATPGALSGLEGDLYYDNWSRDYVDPLTTPLTEA